jgi:hypothetical protein
MDCRNFATDIHYAIHFRLTFSGLCEERGVGSEEDGRRKERRENGHVSWRSLSDNVRHHSLSAAAGECTSEESSLSDGVIRLGLVLVKMFRLPEIRLLFHSTLTYTMHIFSLRIVTKSTLCITTPPQLASPHVT